MNIYFAPIQGITDYIYRNAHSEIYGGVDKYFTPFIRIEADCLRKKDINDLLNSDEFKGVDVELVPQIIANRRDEMRFLLDFVAESGFDCCDINFGCPFPQQSKKYKGSGILQRPDMVAEVLGTLDDYPDMKFSVKMRLGNFSADESVAVADIINDAKLRFVTIHPRLGSQLYGGDLDMEGFSNLVSTIKHPVVFNGNILTVNDFNSIVAQYPKLYAVMIGRGLVANPGLAINCINNEEAFDKSKFMKFMERLAEGYKEYFDNAELMVLDKLKSFLVYSHFDP